MVYIDSLICIYFIWIFSLEIDESMWFILIVYVVFNSFRWGVDRVGVCYICRLRGFKV